LLITSRRLAIDWLPFTERAALGVFAICELVGQARCACHGLSGLCAPRACRHPSSSVPSGSDGRLLRDLTASAGAAG